MRIKLKTHSFCFAEQVLNCRLSIKQEIESILSDLSIKIENLTRPNFNKKLDYLIVANKLVSKNIISSKLYAGVYFRRLYGNTKIFTENDRKSIIKMNIETNGNN